MTRSEVAKYLRFSVDWVDRQLVNYDDAPGYQKGKLRYRLMETDRRKVRILRADVEAMLPQPAEQIEELI